MEDCNRNAVSRTAHHPGLCTLPAAAPAVDSWEKQALSQRDRDRSHEPQTVRARGQIRLCNFFGAQSAQPQEWFGKELCGRRL